MNVTIETNEFDLYICCCCCFFYTTDTSYNTNITYNTVLTLLTILISFTTLLPLLTIQLMEVSCKNFEKLEITQELYSNGEIQIGRLKAYDITHVSIVTDSYLDLNEK